MSKIEVNEIVKSSGSTLTLGGCGTAVTLGSGATQTGFGRSGSVDYDTTIKTADLTAENGKGYFVNTTGGVVIVTLPASPSVGNIVAIKDYAFKFGTNKCTINRNGSNLDGVGTNVDLTDDGKSVTLIYMDATKGWSFINDDTVTSLGQQFVTACGGNTTLTDGNFKTHIFTSPGNFVVSSAGNASGSNSIDYVIVGGGGGGGRGGSPAYMGGGAGAGGFRLSNSTINNVPAPLMSPLSTPSAVTVTAQSYPIVIGAGGSAAPSDNSAGANGSNSSGFSLTSAGGGFGAAGAGSPESGNPGGSGGGSTNAQPAGLGNQPPVSPPQGNPGGVGAPGNNNSGGGGGGAGAAGCGSASPNKGGAGGIGSFISDTIFGPTAPSYGTAGPVSSTRYFSGGGGGSSDGPSVPGIGGVSGGAGGGGDGGTGGNPGGKIGNSGTANTGGAGGGGTGCCGSSPSPTPGGAAGAGGSGIVIIRYKFQ